MGRLFGSPALAPEQTRKDGVRSLVGWPDDPRVSSGVSGVAVKSNHGPHNGSPPGPGFGFASHLA